MSHSSSNNVCLSASLNFLPANILKMKGKKPNVQNAMIDSSFKIKMHSKCKDFYIFVSYCQMKLIDAPYF